MVRALGRPTERVAEIGVALGEFSAVLIDAFKPKEFFAYDIFGLHEHPTLWGRDTSEIFGARTHLEYYKDAMADKGSDIVYRVGISWDLLKEEQRNSFDIIYVDGDHKYEQVVRDAEQAVLNIRGDGILIFNDYVIFDAFGGYEYGVVQVVNDLVVNGGWKIIGFALQNWMFCDIALARPLPSAPKAGVGNMLRRLVRRR